MKVLSINERVKAIFEANGGYAYIERPHVTVHSIAALIAVEGDDFQAVVTAIRVHLDELEESEGE
jgi:hypothetical protein